MSVAPVSVLVVCFAWLLFSGDFGVAWLAPVALVGQDRQGKRRGERDREHEGIRDASGERAHPPLGGEGQVPGAVRFVEAGECGGTFVGY